MPYVTSADGTQIAYSIDGSGPAVILTTGSLDDGSENARLATELSRWFRVVNYARRGRGESGDGREYSVAREIEDIAALIDAAGGRPCRALRRVDRRRPGPRDGCHIAVHRCGRSL
ncbi:alpha/beta fold hydrolase [Bradyrhizobium sp. WSM2793]|uniref:alpha/beta fold hydrolase n=1 Tax=Bradyrhizobium sp. WSM2793 TaxID=1038866 RepID=UPI0018E053E1|nr:hypothetical protein [Bradyrhizobium sp. WSM2793]